MTLTMRIELPPMPHGITCRQPPQHSERQDQTAHVLQKRYEECGHLVFGWSQKDTHHEGSVSKDQQQTS